MINVPTRPGEVANSTQVPAVNNAQALQMYWNSAFSRTYQTDRNQYDQTVVIKYTKNQTSKPQPVKPSHNGSSQAGVSAKGSQMGTAARKELQKLTKNPATGSRLKNMSRAQAQKYVQARNGATAMNANYNGSPAKQDRHNYVGDLPQTGDAQTHQRRQLIAAAVVIGCLSVAVIATVVINRRRHKQSK